MPKEYFIVLEIQNNDEYDIRLNWELQSEKNSMVVRGNSVENLEIKISSAAYPLPVVFDAVGLHNNSSILLRDRKNLFVIPRTEKITEKIIIGMF